MKKRLFSMLVALAMVVGMLPTVALADEVSGVTLTDSLDLTTAAGDITEQDGYTWTHSTGTLTILEAGLTIDIDIVDDSGDDGIILPAGASIILNGDLSITAEDGYGIIFKDDENAGSESKITVSSGKTLSIDSDSDAIKTDDDGTCLTNLTIDNEGTVTIDAESNGISTQGTFTYGGSGTMDIIANGDACIYAYADVTLDGTVKLTNTNDGGSGIYADGNNGEEDETITITINGVMTISVTGGEPGYGDGIVARDELENLAIINNGILTINTSGDAYCGIDAWSTALSITGSGTLTSEGYINCNSAPTISTTVSALVCYSADDKDYTIVYGDVTLSEILVEYWYYGDAISFDDGASLTIPAGVTLDLNEVDLGDDYTQPAGSMDTTGGKLIVDGVLIYPADTVVDYTNITGDGVVTIGETNYNTDGETILVLEGLALTTVEVDAEANAGYTWIKDEDVYTLSFTGETVISGAIMIGYCDEQSHEIVSIDAIIDVNNTITVAEGIYASDNLTITGDDTLTTTGIGTADAVTFPTLTIDTTFNATEGFEWGGNIVVNSDMTTCYMGALGLTVKTGATLTLTGIEQDGTTAALLLSNATAPVLDIGSNSILTPADGGYVTKEFTEEAGDETSTYYMGTITSDGADLADDFSNMADYIVIGYKKPVTTTTTTTTTTKDPEPEVTTSDDGSVTATVEASGSYSDSTATSTVKNADMEAAIEAAVEAAEGESVSVEIPVTTRYSTTTVEATFSVEALTALVEGDIDNLIVSSDIGTVVIPAEALATMAEEADGSAIVITVSAVDISEELTEEQKAITGDATVYDLTVTCDGVAIRSFGDCEVTVHIPYILREGETAGNIVVWYIADDGAITPMNSIYDEEAQMASFTTSHFSLFAVMHDTNVFEDIDPNDYYYDAVIWAVDKCITAGTDEAGTLFSPTMACTRAQAVTFLWRAAGEPVVDYINPFTDVDADSYYYEAVLWAAAEGITQGTSETEFSPNATCSRSEIVTLLWRDAEQPVVNYLMDFSDVAGDTWYSEAVRWAVSETVAQGAGDKEFSPDADCTRAEIVTFLYRYLAD